jgi:NAD(P)-dependent dehydrogenase (short-subunit alcohol dehydrogenase family)
MTLPIARDLSKRGVRIMTIAPGVFETPMMAGAPDAVREPLIAITQFPKRLGNPAEFAQEGSSYRQLWLPQWRDDSPRFGHQNAGLMRLKLAS